VSWRTAFRISTISLLSTITGLPEVVTNGGRPWGRFYPRAGTLGPYSGLYATPKIVSLRGNSGDLADTEKPASIGGLVL